MKNKYVLLILLIILGNINNATGDSYTMNENLIGYIEKAIADTASIPEERKQELQNIASYVRSKLDSGTNAELVFICTHNSRRSHMSQIWAQAAAVYFNLQGVKAYSGGTEATAFNPRAVKALVNAGFIIKKEDENNNPVYKVQTKDYMVIAKAFSKKFSDKTNPQKDFAAIMTCSQADESCPIVPGADARISIPYEDPKKFDDTDQETKMYDERCRQIATEMLYAFSKVYY